MRIAIVWGSTTGNTQSAADRLCLELGERVELCASVEDVSVEQMRGFDVLLIGASTWDVGELQHDWPDRVEAMAKEDWSNTYFGFFGCGDAYAYEDTFVDAFGIIWEHIQPCGAMLIGKWPTRGYEFSASRALCESGKMFLGLALDEENQPDMTEDRVKRWASQICSELDTVTPAA